MKLKDHVVIISGGASGLGQASSLYFAEQGAKIAILDLQQAQGEGLTDRLIESYGKDCARFYHVDITSEDALMSALSQIKKTQGSPRIAINCAGVSSGAKVVGHNGIHSLEQFSRTIKINLIGTFNVIRLAAQAMTENEPLLEGERGVIISTASVAAFDGQIGQAAYSASKAGVAGMTLPIARELASWGIRVNTIAPGIFDTPMMQGFKDEVRQTLEAQVPYPNRSGNPEEFARLAAHIAENRYINGETIRLDGGIRMPPK